MKYKKKNGNFGNEISYLIHNRGDLNKGRHNRGFCNDRNTKICNLVKKLLVKKNTNNPT